MVATAEVVVAEAATAAEVVSEAAAAVVSEAAAAVASEAAVVADSEVDSEVVLEQPEADTLLKLL